MNDLREYDPQRVGVRLRAVRMAHGLSQSEFVAKCSFSVPALSNWERGRQRPSIEYASEIADVFGLTLDYILRGKAETLTHSVFLHLQQTDRS